MANQSIEDMERLSLVSRLGRPVNAGDTTLRFRAVLDGIAGEEFLVDPFSAYNEVVAVSSYDRRDANLTTGLLYAHDVDAPVVRKKFIDWFTSSLEAVSLNAAASATDTTVVVTNRPKGATANSCWVVIDPYTTECEVRKVTNIASNTLTIAALTYNHAEGDGVLFVNSPELNVVWFGAKGDGTTDDTAAIQAALDEVSSFSAGKNIYTHVYFPTGQYLCNTSLDITNRWFFILRGDGWGSSVIIGAATGKPVLDLLGSRFFDIRDLTIKGDSTNTPTTAMFFGRTVTGPNCGNCWIENVALDGEFSAAAIYNYRSEVITINGLRSGPNDCDAPYIYYVTDTNDLSVTSDYDSLDATYNGSSQQRLTNWWVNTKTTGYAASGIRLGNGAHSSYIRNVYYNLYGGTGYQLTLYGTIEGIVVEGLGGEGTYAGGMKVDTATIKKFSFRNIILDGFLSTGSSALSWGVFEEGNGLDSGDTLTFETINYSRIISWWVWSNNNMTITTGVGNIIENPGGGTITVPAGNHIIQVSLLGAYQMPALKLGASGSTLSKLLMATASVDFASIGAGAEGYADVTLTGAAYGNLAFASPRTGLTAGLVIKEVIAQTNNVRIYLYNYSGGAIDEAAQNWTVAVIG